jgi:hypothetical protein
MLTFFVRVSNGGTVMLWAPLSLLLFASNASLTLTPSFDPPFDPFEPFELILVTLLLPKVMILFPPTDSRPPLPLLAMGGACIVLIVEEE